MADFQVHKSSLNMMRVAWDVFGPLQYLCNGTFFIERQDGILYGDNEFVWNESKTECYGPSELLDISGRKDLRNKYSKAVASQRHNEYPENKHRTRIRLDDLVSVNSDDLSLREAEPWEPGHWMANGYTFAKTGIPCEGDNSIEHYEDSNREFIHLMDHFAGINARLNNIYWPHAASRILTPEAVRSTMFGDRFLVLKKFCHEKSVTEDDLVIYPRSRAYLKKSFPYQQHMGADYSSGIVCYGCHYSERWVTIFVTKQLGFDPGLIRGFFQPYYDRWSSEFPAIPQKIKDLSPRELTAAMLGSIIY